MHGPAARALTNLVLKGAALSLRAAPDLKVERAAHRGVAAAVAQWGARGHW